jgi:hypothetical protein
MRRQTILSAVAGGLLATGIAAAQDLNSPSSFIPITPCRVVDTRQVGGPTGPITSAVTTLTITGAAYAGVLASANPCAASSGAPAGAYALAVNFTMVQVAGPTDLRVAPGGTLPTSSVMNSTTGMNLANASVVPVNSLGQIAVKSGGANFNLIIDVFGYYWDDVRRSDNRFNFFTNSSGYALYAINYSTSCTGTCGMYLESDQTGTGGGLFVQESDTGIGVHLGIESVVHSTGDGSSGVAGFADGSGGRTYGVQGKSVGGLDSAGVIGFSLSGSANATGRLIPAGVRGEGLSDIGVLGLSHDVATDGILLDATGAYQCEGSLGRSGFDVFAFGGCGMGGTGPKMFVEPHPTDPAKEIRYVSLEGPESGTYFRGKGQIVNGFATIDVPETFRIVTDADGLTAVVSPVGEMATLAVISQDLSHIVVQGSKDVTFNYIVNGVRKAYKDLQPIHENVVFVPRGAGDQMSPSFSPEIKSRLIATGIYNADGSVNLATAHRMGWDRLWADRDAKSKQLADDARAAAAAEHAANLAKANAQRP